MRSQMLQGDSACSGRAAFKWANHEAFQIGGAVNVCPLIEEGDLQANRLGCSYGLGEYAVRAPVDSTKQIRM